MLTSKLSNNFAEKASSYKWSNLAVKSKSRKRLIRYGLLSLNIAVLVIVIFLVAQNPSSNQTNQQGSLSALGSNSNVATNPLDQLSSADIAAHVARLTKLDEANSVVNQADSVTDQLAVASVDNQVIAKPQILNTNTKTRKDIIRYVSVAGDTVPSLAAKFAVTSESIRWSNSLTGDSISVGKELWISPVSNGIVYLVKSGDTLQSVADKYHVNKEVVASFNDAEAGALPVGERIVVPGGSVQSARVSFTWGGSTAIYGGNGYDYGWCTWYVAIRRAEIGRPVPSNLGNAYSWYSRANSVGIPTGSQPQVGAVAVNERGNHVSVVEVVNPDGSFWISEMNSRGQISINDPTPTGGWRVKDYKFYPSASGLKFVY